jgi:preprotein translocase subunit SecG
MQVWDIFSMINDVSGFVKWEKKVTPIWSGFFCTQESCSHLFPKQLGHKCEVENLKQKVNINGLYLCLVMSFLVFTFSLACLVIGCTLITHGSMFGNKAHIGEQDKTSHSRGVHTRSYYIFQTLVLMGGFILLILNPNGGLETTKGSLMKGYIDP